MKKEEYQEYIKKITPMHCLWKEMLGAFVVGGVYTLGLCYQF